MRQAGTDVVRDSEDLTPAPTIEIGSLAELTAYESEILRRIGAVPNGGNLFMTHPFMLFGEIGIELTAAAKEAIVAAEPQLANLSERPYRALKASRSPQRVRVNLKGLFRRTTE